MTEGKTEGKTEGQGVGARPRIVLGIDPGTRVVGYGALALHRAGPKFLAAGVLRASARLPVPERLGRIRRDLDDLLLRLGPSVVAIEEAYSGRNVQSALRIGEGRGVAISSAAAFGAEVVQMPPATAKKAVTGNGGASKHQVAEMVKLQLGRSEELPEDATDALALALCCVQKIAIAGSLSRAASRPRGAS